MFDWNSIIGPAATAVFTGIFTGVGVYVALSNRLAVLETKVDLMSENLSGYNALGERLAVLDKTVASDSETQWKRIDECRNDIDSLMTEHYKCIGGSK